MPVPSGRETAIASVGVVGRHTVISASLHIERSQIGAPSVLAFLEQVVRQLFCDGIVYSLRDLVHETGEVLVTRSWSVHVERIQKHFAQPPGSHVLMSDAPPFDG